MGSIIMNSHQCSKEDASHSSLTLLLSYVVIKIISKFGAESGLYAGVTLAFPIHTGWRARDGLQQYNFCPSELTHMYRSFQSQISLVLYTHVSLVIFFFDLIGNLLYIHV